MHVFHPSNVSLFITETNHFNALDYTNGICKRYATNDVLRLYFFVFLFVTER